MDILSISELEKLSFEEVYDYLVNTYGTLGVAGRTFKHGKKDRDRFLYFYRRLLIKWGRDISDLKESVKAELIKRYKCLIELLLR